MASPTDKVPPPPPIRRKGGLGPGAAGLASFAADAAERPAPRPSASAPVPSAPAPSVAAPPLTVPPVAAPAPVVAAPAPPVIAPAPVPARTVPSPLAPPPPPAEPPVPGLAAGDDGPEPFSVAPPDAVIIDDALLAEDAPDKLYFRIGEVADIVGVDAHVLRYWESEFRMKPHRSASGQRLYRKQDLARFLRIKHLLHDEGYTIAGARKALSQGAGAPAAADPARIRTALERLQSLRASILELRDLVDGDR